MLARVAGQLAAAVPGAGRCRERSAPGQPVIEYRRFVLRGPVDRPEVAQLHVAEGTDVALNRIAVVVPARVKREVRVSLTEQPPRLGPAPTECGGGGDQIHALLEAEVVHLEPRRRRACGKSPAPGSGHLVEIEIGRDPGKCGQRRIVPE